MMGRFNMSNDAQSETRPMSGTLAKTFQGVKIKDFRHMNRAALHRG